MSHPSLPVLTAHPKITSLMNAYWKSGQTEKAEEILNSMEVLTHVQPDAIAYTTVINAWGRSSHRNRATRA
jgi:pentatricopeptide repeat protein